MFERSHLHYPLSIRGRGNTEAKGYICLGVFRGAATNLPATA